MGLKVDSQMSNVESMTIESARDLVANQALWPRVRDFLWDFVPQIHESWLEGVAGRESLDSGLEDAKSHVQRLKSSPGLKRFILDSLGVEPVSHAFPKNDGSRLLLLDAATIESIAKWLGALACSDQLRKVMDGATVRELKAALSGVYPEVFGYTAYFNVAAKSVEDVKNTEEIVAIGFKMLFSQFADLPSSLVSRLKFKLPRSLCGFLVLCDKKEWAIPSSTILKLFKLKFPEAYSLCCS